MGLPTNPFKIKLLQTFSSLGYWIFVPRYRGTWESGGKFLQISPTEDIREVINGIVKGFLSSGQEKIIKIPDAEINLIANSFGGPCGFLLSRDPRIKKVVAVSPVVDWREDTGIEPMEELQEFANLWFGQAYRGNSKALVKLKRGKFYNPAESLSEIDGRKILVVHAKNDLILPYRSVVKFARKIGAEIKLHKHGGHFGSSDIIKPMALKLIQKFLKTN